DLEVEDAVGGLGGEVGGGQAGAAGGDHEVVAVLDGVAERLLDLVAVVDDDRPGHVEAARGEPLDQDGPGGVLVDAVGGAVRRHHHDGAYRCHVPVFPPIFSSTWTSVIRAAGSRALTMSTNVSPATDTAVSAS